MATASVRLFDCSPEDVFAVLGDGWVYPSWVVGASRMRAVDPQWPAAGSSIHHSLGVWPILIDDETQVVEWSPPQRLRLRAKAGPFGRTVVVIEARPRGTGCVVRLAEQPVGAARGVPSLLWAPLLHLRNEETIRRLRYLAEGRRRERAAPHEHGDDETHARPGVPMPADGVADADAVADTAEAIDAHEAASGR